MKKFRVVFTNHANADLLSIYRYIRKNDSPTKAEGVVDNIENVIRKLEELPERGNVPHELLGISSRDIREVNFKPYRIIYRIAGDTVIIHLIADGRRDLQALLEQRLLR